LFLSVFTVAFLLQCGNRKSVIRRKKIFFTIEPFLDSLTT
jgi:hypothetical protein